MTDDAISTSKDETISQPAQAEEQEDESLQDDKEHITDIDHSCLVKDFLNSFTARTTEINKNHGPPNTTSFSAFKSFWRDHLNNILHEMDASNESNLPIASPTLKALDIVTLNDDDPSAHECPCCLDPRVVGKAEIRVRSETDISRRILIEALRDQLYGEDVKAEDVRLSERHMGRLVVKGFEYMRQGEDEDGNEIFYWGCDYDERTVYLFVGDEKVGGGSKL